MEKNKLLLIVTMVFITVLLGIISFKIEQKLTPIPYSNAKVVIAI